MMNLASSMSASAVIVSSGEVELIRRNAGAGAGAGEAELDVALQAYAFEALLTGKIRTGVAYEGAVVPCNLTGIPVSYYPPPLAQSYTYLAPVLGLLAYDASHLESDARNTTPLYIHASADPTCTANLKCLLFHVNGSVTLTNMSSDNICTTVVQGHFSVVVESPPPPPPSSTGNSTSTSMSKKKKKNIVGGVFGGFALMVMLGMGLVGANKYKHRKKMYSMEMVAEFSTSPLLAPLKPLQL